MAQVNKQRKEKSIELVNKLFMVSIFLQKTGNKQITKYGLNQSQFAVLKEIVNNKDLSQKDILGEFLLEKSNLSKIIKKLEQMDLIKINTPEADKRITVLNSTPEGKKMVNECMDELDGLKVLFLQSLSDEELAKIHSSIENLESIVIDYIKSLNTNKK